MPLLRRSWVTQFKLRIVLSFPALSFLHFPMLDGYPKPVKKEIVRLLEMAWERELAAALGELHEKFHRWEAGEMTPFDLSDQIHQFHEGTARDLWKAYNGRGLEDLWAARAIANGIIRRDEVSETTLAALASHILSYDDSASEDAASGPSEDEDGK